jgi:hypothetical protein
MTPGPAGHCERTPRARLRGAAPFALPGRVLLGLLRAIRTSNADGIEGAIF